MDAHNDLRPTRTVAALLAVTIVVLGLGLVACGGSDESAVGTGTSSTTEVADPYGGSGGSGGSGGTGAGSTIDAEDFSLTSISVAPGTTVTFSNEGSAQHSVTADDGAFDTDPVKPGTTATFTAPSEPGAYAYHCKIHPSMTGTLTVGG